MRIGGTCSLIHSLRAHACKAVIFAVIIFILEYFFNLFVCREPVNKIVIPGLAWFSNLNKKLGFGENKMSSVWDTSQPCIYNCNSTIVNSSLIQPEIVETNFAISSENTSKHKESLEECPLVPPKLVGRLKILTESPSFQTLENLFYNLDPGGHYKPSDCVSRNKVALIIPFRDREEHLRIFLHNMHPILQRQQLDYGIYVIEESADRKFNRAMLMNIGFVEAFKQYDYDCFVFHDVDLIPEDDRNLYTCPRQPRHMSVAIDTMNYRLPYKDIFGGVSALTKIHMETVNGFSNEFWGWGGEDDDMSNRIRHHGLQISRYSPKIARYTMLKHKQDDPNPDRFNKLYRGKYRFNKDGLNNLKYKTIDLVLKKLYTWVFVEIAPIKK